MASAVLVSVSEYLASTYRPDCDYIAGELKERPMGERPHTLLQMVLGKIFLDNVQSWHALPLGDQRVQTSADHYRVADVCVVRDTAPEELIVQTPPLLCIEILSRNDGLSELQDRVNDYAGMGVENIWALDPWLKLGYYASTRGFQQPEDGVLRVPGTPIAIVLSELFA